MNSNLHQSGQPRLQPNDQLREYRIIQLIGVGGMGAVYKAEHEVTKTKVAIKEILFSSATSDTESYQRLENAFLKEARLLMNLNLHRLPTEGALIPRAHTLFREGSRWYLLMDYIHGETLAEMLENNQHRPLPIEKIQAWLLQLLITLDYLHRQVPPLIHRDIKPANLKINEDGRLVLLDFGISKGGDSNTATIYSHSVQFYSPHYAPPEQLFGRGTDARSDLFAAAATMYTLLAGTPPPKAEVRNYAKLQGEPDPLLLLDRKNRTLPTSLVDALQSALALRPENRPNSATDMVDIIRGYRPAPIPVDSTPVPRRIERDVRNERTIARISKRRQDITDPVDPVNNKGLVADKWGTPARAYVPEHTSDSSTSFPWLYVLMVGVGLLMIMLIVWTLNGGESLGIETEVTNESNAIAIAGTETATNNNDSLAPTETVVNSATQTAAAAAGQPIPPTSTRLATSTLLPTNTPAPTDTPRSATATNRPAATTAPQATANAPATPTPRRAAATSTTGSGGTSEPRSAVSLITPGNNAAFAEGTGIQLSWQAPPLSTNEQYTVRVWKQSAPNAAEREFSTRDTSAVLNGLNPESYEWQVSITGPDGIAPGSPSGVRSFAVTSVSQEPDPTQIPDVPPTLQPNAPPPTLAPLAILAVE